MPSRTCSFLVLLQLSGLGPDARMWAQAPPILWDRDYGGSNYEDLNFVRQTTDGGYISAGWSQSPISGTKTQANWDPSNNTPDYWIVKSDAFGTVQWDKRFGGTNWETCGSIQQTTDGGYILGGYSSSPVSGNKTQASKGVIDYWIVKLDAAGGVQWDKTYGGTSNDYLTRVIQTADGGYLLCGFSESGIGADRTENSRGAEDYWLVKTDASGVKLWDHRFGGPQDDYAYHVVQTTDGGYLISGTSASGAGGDKTQTNRGPLNTMDYWVVKTDVNGIKQWDKRFGTSDDDLCAVALQTADGGYILGGYSAGVINGDRSVNSRGSYDYWLVKTDAAGTKLWDTRYGGSAIDYLFTMQITTDGGFILGGTTYSGVGGDKTEPSRGNEDYWIIKTTAAGAVQWDKTMGGSGSDWLNRMQQTTDGYYICGGQSSSPISGEKTQALVGGSNDYWLIKLGTDTGLPIGLTAFTGENHGNENDLSWTTATEQDNDRFELQRSKDGDEWGTIDIIPGAGTSQQGHAYHSADRDPYALTYYRLRQVDLDGDQSMSNIVVLRAGEGVPELLVGPNPATDHLWVLAPSGFGATSVAVVTMDGRLFGEQPIDPTRSTPIDLDVAKLPAGAYIVLLRSRSMELRATWLKAGS
jgi:hypothetical protein